MDRQKNQNQAPTELGTESISKLLIQYATPAIIAMTASSLYNIADSIFIGHGVGPLALAGLGVTFPLMNITTAFGMLMGVGSATLVSVRLGQKDYDNARLILGNTFVMNVILGLALTVLGLIFINPILTFFGASPATLPYAHDFMEIILLGNVVTHLYFGMNALLRSSGAPKKAMYATIGSVVINIILNPLFIFGFGWGIRGSAIATVIAQVVMMCWQFHIFSDKSNFLHFQKGIYRLKKHIVLTSMSIGLSPFLMNVASCFLVVLINQGLKHYGGDMAIGAFSNVNRIMFIFGMIVMGFNQAMQPIAGYNFGAQLYTRVTQVLKITIVCATAVMVLGFFIGEFMPRQVALIFTNDEELIRQTVLGLRLCFISAPVVGFQMVTSNFFQSIGMAKKSIFLSLTRQLIFLLPAILILPPIYGLNGVWLSMPISDLVATFTSAAMLAYQFRKFHRGDKIKTV